MFAGLSGGIVRKIFTCSSRTESTYRSSWRLHGKERDHLQQVVLHHIADGAGLFVELASALHAERFGHRDLHAVNVMRVQGSARESCWRSGR